MTRDFVEKRVEAALEEARQKIQRLADEFRERRLLPFCRRHRLTFVAGMGRTVFYRRGRPVDSTDLAALASMEEIMDIDAVGRNDAFGFYIADVTEEDIGS